MGEPTRILHMGGRARKTQGVGGSAPPDAGMSSVARDTSVQSTEMLEDYVALFLGAIYNVGAEGGEG